MEKPLRWQLGVWRGPRPPRPVQKVAWTRQTCRRIVLQNQAWATNFLTTAAQPPCAACHSLKAAGAKGVVGPNLDELRPDAQRIRTALAQGVGAMPAYADQLSDAEVTALVAFITSSQ